MLDTTIALLYLYMFNVITFGLFAWDKHLAIYGKKRIPEWLLLFFSALGGAFGALCAMMFFKHKTRHARFCVCVPVFFIIHVIIFMLIRFL